jgi:uncharacterized phage protein (TIGR02216 family)
MAFGLGHLRLSPEVFWRMTPRELAAAMGGPAQRNHLSFERGALARLMRAFPDEEMNHG